MAKTGPGGSRGTKRAREAPRAPRREGVAPGLRTHLGVVVVLFLALLVFHWRVLVAGGAAQGWLWEDALEYFYPVHSLAASWIARGSLPLWDPYTFAGMPLLADIGAGLLYPANFLLALFVHQGVLSFRAFEWMMALHVWLAGAGAYFLAWRLTRSFWGSVTAAFIFMFGGFMTAHCIHLSIVQTAAWLPFIFWFSMRAVEEERARPAALAGLLLGIATLAGHPQTSLLVAGAMLVPALVAAIMPAANGDAPAPGPRRGWLRRLAPFRFPILSGIIAVGVAAPQLLATRELLGLTIRQEMSYKAAAEGSFGPWSFLTFLAPNFFGKAHGRNWGAYWGPGSYFYYWELAAYVSLAGIFLAALAFGERADRRARRALLMLAVLGAAGLLLAMGKYGGLHFLLYWALPPLRRLRIPARAVLLLDLAVALLAAYGTRRLAEKSGTPSGPRLGRWTTAAAVVTLAGLAAGGLRLAGHPAAWIGQWGANPRPVAQEALVHLAVTGALLAAIFRVFSRSSWSADARGALVALFVLADLFRVGWGYSAGGESPDVFFTSNRGQIIQALSEEGKHEYFRLNARPEKNPDALVLRRNAGPILGISMIEGYNQLKLADFQDFKVPSELRLDLLNVRYVSELNAERALRVVRNPGFLPRAFFVPRGREAGSEKEALELMNAPGFNPVAEVVLLGGSASPAQAADSQPPPASAADSTVVAAEITHYEPNRIAAELTAPSSGYVVFSEIWYPAWRARVDGREAPLRRADYCLRAVPVPAGHHTVEIRMSRSPVHRGLLLSLLTLTGAAAVVWLDERRRKAA